MSVGNTVALMVPCSSCDDETAVICRLLHLLFEVFFLLIPSLFLPFLFPSSMPFSSLLPRPFPSSSSLDRSFSLLCLDEQDLKNQTRVQMNVVRCPPVTTVLIRRPALRLQLGFSVQNGIVGKSVDPLL